MTLLQYSLITIIMAALGLWGQVRFILSFPLRLIIETKSLRQETAEVLLVYLSETSKRKSGNRAVYWSCIAHVKPLGRIYRVFLESLSAGRQLFIKNRRPIWYVPSPGRSPEIHYLISYIKGTVDWFKLLSDAAAWEDEKRAAITETRFKISYHGNDQSRQAPQLLKGLADNSPSPIRTEHFISADHLLHWDREDIGMKEAIILEHMSLRPELLEIINEVKFFLDSKEWFEEKGIPWRRGWLLHGKPGTGKTSFVRGVAAKFNLPVHVFDLSSMSNHVFRCNWEQATCDAPCIVLIEDIDTVFNGRQNLNQATMLDNTLTYDCLLNCIGGITIADGVIVFVSSNKPETIDGALLRGGRLDRSIEVLGLDYEGRIKLAERILGNRTEAIEMANNPAYENMTPAELQEALSRIAILRRFS